jgi:hypothetical protein
MTAQTPKPPRPPKPPKILLIGPGELGGVLLELLARQDGLGPIVVGGRDPGRGEARCNLARIGAMAQGHAPDIRFLKLNLRDVGAAAEALRRVAPDIVVTTASLQAWWLPELLPEQERAWLGRAHFGVWLPIHLPLTLNLMEAVREAQFKGVVLTAPYPDVVNCVLGRLGLAPTCGVGNLDEIVPKIRLLAAERLRAPLAEIRVILVAHHALEPAAFAALPLPAGDVPPYFLRVYRGAEDVTAVVRADELLLAPYPLPPGPAWSFLTAGSTVRLIRALFSESETLLHAPGPLGLPGGYPILAGGGAIRPAPIDGLSGEEAVALNERSHRFDGIERIDPDGTVVFRGESVEIMRQAFGYDCQRLRPDEAVARATELMARFKEYASRLGVRLPER